MLKIGEFSKIAQVSVKTLRYYDEVGLLKPIHIDRYTGYRYYNLQQLMLLNRILALKDLDFSLDQIKTLLKADLSGQSLQTMLENKATELRERIHDENSRLLRVENRLIQLRSSENTSLSPVIIKSSNDQSVITVRQVLPTVELLKEWQMEQLEKIKYLLEQNKQRPNGPQILIYHQDEYRDSDLDVEVGLILEEPPNRKINIQSSGNMNFYALKGNSQMATTLYSFPHSSPSKAYTHLTKWTQMNGFRPIGPWRELTYQQDDINQAKLIEVQRPIMKASQYYQEMELKEMEPEIKVFPSFTLVGMRYFGRNEKQEISELWAKFNRRIRALGGLKNETGDAAIGLCITPEDAPADGSFEYVAGFPVNRPEEIPEGFVIRKVPEYTYAVFSHKGNLAGLSKTYEYIYETWLPQSGYQLAAKMDFEYYDQEFENFAPDSKFYIFVPIERVN